MGPAVSPALAKTQLIPLLPPVQKIAPSLLSRIATDPLTLQPVILEMQQPTAPFLNQPDLRLAQQALGLLSTFGIPVGTLPIVDGAAGWLPGAAIQTLSLLPGVAFIAEDSTVAPRGSTAPPPVWPAGSLTSLYPQETHVDRVWAQSQGRGVGVAVLDSGVAADQDLAGRVLASVSFAGGRDPSKPDPGGHGTHVAGIIAGNGTRSQGQFVGMAPTANILDVQVLDAEGNGRLSSIIAGLGWTVAHRTQYNIRVANLSFGAPPTSSYELDPLSAAVEVAWKRGIVVVAAAGNTGPASGTVESPGIDPYIITVGATDDQGTLSTSDDQFAWFSSWGTPSGGQPKPDIVAPGRRIASIRVPGSTLDGLYPAQIVTAANGSTYFRLTGTSQATGVVSGAAALVIAHQPNLTPDQVKAILMGTTQGYGPNNQPVLPAPTADGAGLLDAAAAFNSGPRGTANAGLRPTDAYARVMYPLLFGQPLNWKNPLYNGILWNLLTWQTLSWNNIAWDNIAWDSFSTSNIAWDNIAWDGGSWDNIAWDRSGWDNIAWDDLQAD